MTGDDEAKAAVSQMRGRMCYMEAMTETDGYEMPKGDDRGQVVVTVYPQGGVAISSSKLASAPICIFKGSPL